MLVRGKRVALNLSWCGQTRGKTRDTSSPRRGSRKGRQGRRMVGSTCRRKPIGCMYREHVNDTAMGSDGGGAAAGRGREKQQQSTSPRHEVCQKGRPGQADGGRDREGDALYQGRRTSALGWQGGKGIDHRSGRLQGERAACLGVCMSGRAHAMPAAGWLPWDDWRGPLQSPHRRLAGLRSPGLGVEGDAAMRACPAYGRRRRRRRRKGSSRFRRVPRHATGVRSVVNRCKRARPSMTTAAGKLRC